MHRIPFPPRRGTAPPGGNRHKQFQRSGGLPALSAGEAAPEFPPLCWFSYKLLQFAGARVSILMRSVPPPFVGSLPFLLHLPESLLMTYHRRARKICCAEHNRYILPGCRPPSGFLSLLANGGSCTEKQRALGKGGMAEQKASSIPFYVSQQTGSRANQIVILNRSFSLCLLCFPVSCCNVLPLEHLAFALVSLFSLTAPCTCHLELSCPPLVTSWIFQLRVTRTGLNSKRF